MGPLFDPYILRDGPEYLHILASCGRDLLRFQESMQNLVDFELERIQKDAVKVKRDKPIKGGLTFDVGLERALGSFDDSKRGPN